MPAWLALIVHVPAVSSVKVEPLAVQTAVVVDSNDTGKPEEALATIATGAVPSVWLPGEMKVMLCAISGAAATLKVCITIAAPAKLLLPGWLAATVQPPGATSVKAAPLTVQTPGVVDANETARPDVAVAVSAGGAVPKAWLPGDVKLMVCAISGVAATTKVFDTAGAAA